MNFGTNGSDEVPHSRDNLRRVVGVVAVNVGTTVGPIVMLFVVVMPQRAEVLLSVTV